MQGRPRTEKVLVISSGVLMCLLHQWKHCGVMTMPVITNIPDDATVEGISYDPHCPHAFMVRVAHPSFSEIPEGNCPPEEPLDFETVPIQAHTIRSLAEYVRREGLVEPPPRELALECHRIARQARMLKEEPDTVRRRLGRELNHGTWETLNAIADTYEEDGDGVMAAGYRWLAERQKMPYKDADGRWVWGHSSSGDTTDGDGPQSSILPEQACWTIPGYYTGTNYFALPDEAFDAAARVVGEWLARTNGTA